MTIGSRVLRTLLAASTLHLMLAVPARACPTEMAADAASSTHEMPSSMSHAGHHMPESPAEQAPASKSPNGEHMPCCPTPGMGCLPGACLMPVAATLIVVDAAATDTPVSITPSLRAARWVSYAPEPEPPPPRA